MEHIYIILFLSIILILIIFYFEYCYKNSVLEKFEVQLGMWDNVIGLQVLRDMLGIFFNNEKKTFNIPGGISVKEIIPSLGILSENFIMFTKFKKGSVDGRLQNESAITQN